MKKKKKKGYNEYNISVDRMIEKHSFVYWGWENCVRNANESTRRARGRSRPITTISICYEFAIVWCNGATSVADHLSEDILRTQRPTRFPLRRGDVCFGFTDG